MLYVIRFDEYQVTKNCIINAENIKAARAKLKEKRSAACKMKTEKFSSFSKNTLIGMYNSKGWKEWVAEMDLQSTVVEDDGVVILPNKYTRS